MALLDQALHGGRVGRVYRELVLEKQIAVEADGGIDDIFGYNGPTQMTTKILHKPEYSDEQTLAAADDDIAQGLRGDQTGLGGTLAAGEALRPRRRFRLCRPCLHRIGTAAWRAGSSLHSAAR